MFTELRPVGNRIELNSASFEKDLISPYSFVGFQSGTAALAAALISIREVNLPIKNPQVLMPAYTCPDIISACLFAKVEPVLVDFEENSTWMHLEVLESHISDSCIAIIAINFMGIPERINTIRSVVEHAKYKQKITIIEDSAQGFPVNNAETYWLGDFIITSFGRGKPLNLLGGGSLLYDHKQVDSLLVGKINKLFDTRDKSPGTALKAFTYWAKVRLFNLLCLPFFYYFLARLPFVDLGLTVYHSLEQISSLPHYKEEQISVNYKNYRNNNNDRERLRQAYDNSFDDLNPSVFISLPKISQLPEEIPLLRYPILVLNNKLRNTIYNELVDANLGVSKMYSKVLPAVNGIKKSMFTEILNYPNAEKFASSLITLPMHVDITLAHIERIESILLKHSKLEPENQSI